MPRSKNWRTYPESFGDLVREAALREVRIPCESANDARKLVGRLYAYHGALERACKNVGKELDHDEISLVNELRSSSLKVQYRLDDRVIVARPQDQDPANILITNALGRTERPTSQEALRPSADFLASLQQTDPDE